MMAARKKKPEDKNTGTTGSERLLRDDAEKQLGCSPMNSPELKGQSPEQLIHELQVHQIELEIQAEELKKSKLELEESRDKFLDQYDFAPTGLLTVNEKGSIIEVNLTGSTLLGVERSKLIWTQFSKFVAPEDQDQWYWYITNLLQQDGKQYCTLLLKRTGGSAFPSRLEGVRLGSDGIHTGARIAFSDITDMKTAEEALLKTTSYLENLIDYANAPIITWDPEYRITRFNHAFEHMTGRNQKEVLGKKLDFLFPDETSKASLSLIHNLPKGKRWETIEIPILTKDGSVRTVLWNSANISNPDGRIISTIAQGVDITERKRAEEALREEQQFSKLMLDSLPGIFYLYTYPEHQLTRWNKQHETLLGYTADEMKGKLASDWHLPELKDAVLKVTQEVMERGQSSVESNLIAKDGHTIPFYLTGVRFEAQGRLYYLGIGIDITERKKMESEIQSLNRDLEQRVIERTSQLNASLEDKTVLLQEVHHRVRNNFQIIISLLSLQSQYIEDEKANQVFKESKNRIHAMALVHEKLYPSTDMATIDLDSYFRLLGNNLLQFYGVRGRNVILNTRILDIHTNINTAIPIGLIVNELVSNSLKHAFPNGRRGEISIAMQRENALLTIVYKDNGIGIPADQDWRNIKALGLQLVIGLVGQLDGTIELDRTEGTTFTIVVKEMK